MQPVTRRPRQCIVRRAGVASQRRATPRRGLPRSGISDGNRDSRQRHDAAVNSQALQHI